jgi:polysaccharide biosynthesis protein PslG
MPRLSPRAAALAAAVGALLVPLAGTATAPAAPRQVPQGFMGMNVDGPMLDPALGNDAEWNRMMTSGVESVRTSFFWDAAQPYEAWSDVPAAERGRFRDTAGVPTDFSYTDRLVTAAARQRLPVLAVVLRVPRWARKHPDREWSPPGRVEDYARFIGIVARRYGSRGSFWRENPRLPRTPVRDVQFGNEPNGRFFWDDQPPYGGPNAGYHRLYFLLVRASYRALKAADPNARAVLGGFFGEAWYVLEYLYLADRRIRRYFDVAAIHPFTRKPENVRLILRRARQVMNRYGDSRKPLIVTEMSYPSAAGRPNQGFGYEVTESEQASRLTRVYQLLVADRRRLNLSAIHWYTWVSPETGRYSFYYAGLRRPRGSSTTPKPAYGAFRRAALAFEGCRSKRSVSRCG